MSVVKHLSEYLFVGEYEKNRFSELVFGQHSHQLFSSLTDSFPIIAVDNEYQSLSVLKVMPPKGSNLVLSADVPNRETYVLIFNGFHIKTFQIYNRLNKSIIELTDRPIVGIVVTISPNFSLYRIVVFPAASKPTIKIRTCFLPNIRVKRLEMVKPITG